MADEEQPIQKYARKAITPETFKKDLQELHDILTAEIDKQQKKMVPSVGIRSLKSARSKVELLQKRFPKVAKKVRVKRAQSGVKSGIMKPNSITKELADFLKVPHDTKLSRVEIQGALAVYCNVKNVESPSYEKWGYLNPDGKRSLQDPSDKKYIIPDKKLSKLLKYEEYKSKVKSGLVFTTNKKTGERKQVFEERLQYFTITSMIGNLIQKDVDVE